MARLPRLYAPGVPQLLQARFARPLATPNDPTPSAQLQLVQQWLTTEVQARSVALHAWVLLPDRFVLLATPSDATTLPQVVQGIGRRMAARLTHGRSFEGRYRSALVQDSWMLRCCAWVDTLPMREGLVDTPANWPWSSAPDHLGRRSMPALGQYHATYWNLGDTPFTRQARYRIVLEKGLSAREAESIEQSLFGQWALGDAQFAALLSARGSRRAAPAARGRPRKATAANGVTK